jgi:polysaccharide biosynthesis protein PslG
LTRLRRALVLLLMPAAALPAGCGGAEPRREAHQSDFFGVNAQFLVSWSPGRWQPHLESMERGGLGVVRRDAAWEVVQPRPPASPGRHVYRWQATDRMVRALARHGLRWYPIVNYSAPWAASRRGDVFSPPGSVDGYVAFARELAARYGRNGSFWRGQPQDRARPVTAYEIWNEPNASLFWRPQNGAPERYATLYRATRRAIRAVDPRARVVIGGLTTYGPDSTPVHGFLRRMAARLGGLGDIDAVGLHLYGDSLAQVLGTARGARRTLDELGGSSVPLDVTEVGWTTARTPEAVRARWLARLARDLPRSGCRIEVLLPHTWLTAESNRAQPEDWFGIANQDGSLKPSGSAYLRAVRWAETAKRKGPTDICT